LSTLTNIALFDPRGTTAVKPAARPAGTRFDDLLGRQRPRFRRAPDDDLGIHLKRRRSDAAAEGLAREPAAGGERANDNRPESAARRGLSDPFTTRADRFGGLLHLDVGFLAQDISQEVMPEDGAHSSRYSAAGSAAYRATIQRTDAYLVPDLEELLVT